VYDRRLPGDRRPRPQQISPPRRRHRAGQRVLHRPLVHMMADCQLPDRDPSRPPVLPDLLKQLQTRPRHPDLLADSNDVTIRPRAGPRPVQVITLRGTSLSSKGMSALTLLHDRHPTELGNYKIVDIPVHPSMLDGQTRPRAPDQSGLLHRRRHRQLRCEPRAV
jgi:hypothetical protein